MAYSLSSDPLKQFIDTPAINQNGERLGIITDVTSAPSKAETAEYIIVRSNRFDGETDRFFAVPASSELVDLTENRIIFTVARDDLSLAKRIPAKQCPAPNIDFDPPIYELSNYAAGEGTKNANINHE